MQESENSESPPDSDKNFEMVLGGEIVSPKSENPADSESVTPENEKFFKCKFRSEKGSYWQKSSCNCGPGSFVEMFRCLKLDISNLSPPVCRECNFFEKK